MTACFQAFYFMVSLAAEPITHIGSLPITNSLIDTLLVDAILIAVALYINKKASVIPTFFQGMIEMLMQEFYNLTTTVAGKQTMRIFPFVMTFFLFILISN